MSIKVMSKVWELRLPANLKFVLLALADHARDDGTKCFPSVGLLSRKCSCSKRSVQRGLRKLKSLRLIAVVAYAYGGRGKATEYRILVENLPRFLTKAKDASLAPFVDDENGDWRDGISEASDGEGRQALSPQPSLSSSQSSRSADSGQPHGVDSGLHDSTAGLESRKPKPSPRKTRTQKREEGLLRKAEKSYDDPQWKELEAFTAKERAEHLRDLRQACRKLRYNLDLENPLLSLRFAWKLIDTVSKYEGKDILPGILATKVIDECQRENIVWPLDFQAHRKRLRSRERMKESNKS